MTSTIIWTIAIVAILGLLLALVLYFVAERFKVEEDPRIDEVEKVMPGANCGGCGFAGCRAFADAAVKAKDLDSQFCPVGGNDVMKKVAAILGIQVKEKAPMVAVVRCNGSCENRPRTNEYNGAASCKVKAALYAGDTGCSYGCLGCGDCVEACQFGALSMDPATGLPVVDESKCTACGSCVAVCPNAIVLDSNVAYIDFAKCKLCRECEAMCPTGAIHGVGFPKPLDKEAVKGRIQDRQKKAREAAAAAAAAAQPVKKEEDNG